MMAKQMSLIRNIDIGYFVLKSKESLVITRKFENIFNLVLYSPGCDVKLYPAVTLNISVEMRLPSITVAFPPSGLRGCHNLGGRARQQSFTD